MPQKTRVRRCVNKVSKKTKNKGSAIAICQSSTKQSYATGKNLIPEIKKLLKELSKKV